MTSGWLKRSRIDQELVWFPLSKKACLLITHDNERKGKFFELLENAKIKEAKAVTAELSEISCRDINESVLAVNQQTIVNADRFASSRLESDEIPPLFKGDCQNYRIVVGYPAFTRWLI